MHVEHLRSPHEKIGGLCYFARLLDKVRLHAAGNLPEPYHANLGSAFDARCMNFLGITYPALVERINEGGTDAEILAWCFVQGAAPGSEDIEVWNEFMRKRGWKDEASPLLQRRLEEGGFADRTDIQTFFDFIDLDEGREITKPE